jgi:hypothetical protein
LDQARRSQALLEKGFVRVVRDDCRPFGGKSTETAGVIEVLVGVDHVFDRLVRHEVLYRGNDGGGAGIVLQPFDHYEMIAHLATNGSHPDGETRCQALRNRREMSSKGATQRDEARAGGHPRG